MLCEFKQHEDHWKCAECSAISPSRNLVAECGAGIDYRPHVPEAVEAAMQRRDQSGAGTELKQIFEKWQERANRFLPDSRKFHWPPCQQCNAVRAKMNIKGVEWCEANIDTLAADIGMRARGKGVPLPDKMCKVLIRRAIKKAKLPLNL